MGKFVALTICWHIVLPFLNIMQSEKKQKNEVPHLGGFDATFTDLDEDDFGASFDEGKSVGVCVLSGRCTCLTLGKLLTVIRLAFVVVFHWPTNC